MEPKNSDLTTREIDERINDFHRWSSEHNIKILLVVSYHNDELNALDKRANVFASTSNPEDMSLALVDLSRTDTEIARYANSLSGYMEHVVRPAVFRHAYGTTARILMAISKTLLSVIAVLGAFAILYLAFNHLLPIFPIDAYGYVIAFCIISLFVFVTKQNFDHGC